LSVSVPAYADIVKTVSGAELRGTVIIKTDKGITLKTDYGNLDIPDSDVAEIIKVEKSTASAAGEAAIDPLFETAGKDPVDVGEYSGVDISTSADEQEYKPVKDVLKDNQTGSNYVFLIMPAEYGRTKAIYFDHRVPVATEIFGSDGKIEKLIGRIPDAVFSEFYSDGTPRTVKGMKNGILEGDFKTYYPGGQVSLSGSYKNGEKEGRFTAYSTGGTVLWTVDYSKDKKNGWKKDYSPEGKFLAANYYKDDKLAAPPRETDDGKSLSGIADENIKNIMEKNADKGKAAVAGDTVKTDVITVKTKKIARGEIYYIKVNKKNAGRVRLDKDLNIIEEDIKMKDNTVNIYSKKDILRRALVIRDNAVAEIHVYEENDPMKGDYTVDAENKAVRK